MVAVDADRPDRTALREPAAALRDGGLVAFPTETVYGLGADATSVRAVRRIFAAKGRPADNPLIVHVASPDHAWALVATVTPLARALAAEHWPGPLTLVLDAAELPAETTGGLTTVGVRIPAHPVALALLEEAGVPVAAPSANLSGRPSPTTAAHVLDDLGDVVDWVVDGGPARVGVESTVVDARGRRPVVLREGGIPREVLAAHDREPSAPTSPAEPHRSPGTRYAHYQPRCRVDIAPQGAAVRRSAELAAAGLRVGLVAPHPAPTGVRQVARPDSTPALAALLFTALREAEAAGVDVVVVEAVPEEGLGRAVMDRLRRAAAD